MEDKGITAEQLIAEMQGEFKALAVEVSAAMNAAKAGRIIADTEEPVRDANAVFRERMFQKALSLLQAKQEAFSPSGQKAAEQGQAGNDAPDDQRTSRDLQDSLLVAQDRNGRAGGPVAWHRPGAVQPRSS